MKVNTDGVLLGAWVDLPKDVDTPKVLDIGTGSGVIALMLAQRLFSQNFWIDALEPHPSSAQTALENLTQSPWASSMGLYPVTLQDYVNSHQMSEYDLIISNPPYFEDSLRPSEKERCFVRHTDSLSHTELLEGVAALLHTCGRFGVVLPALQKDHFVRIATAVGLYLQRETIVYTKPNRPPKRVLMEFVKKEEPLQSDCLTIHEDDGNSFTTEYKELTNEFYLDFLIQKAK